MAVRKINQKDYTHWVVVAGKIESGWSNAEDAREMAEGNLPARVEYKVCARAGLRKLGLDPNDNDAWLVGPVPVPPPTVKIEVQGLFRDYNGKTYLEVKTTVSTPLVDYHKLTSLVGDCLGDHETLWRQGEWFTGRLFFQPNECDVLPRGPAWFLTFNYNERDGVQDPVLAIAALVTIG